MSAHGDLLPHPATARNGSDGVLSGRNVDRTAPSPKEMTASERPGPNLLVAGTAVVDPQRSSGLAGSALPEKLESINLSFRSPIDGECRLDDSRHAINERIFIAPVFPLASEFRPR
jgi:hypothetical protein